MFIDKEPVLFWKDWTNSYDNYYRAIISDLTFYIKKSCNSVWCIQSRNRGRSSSDQLYHMAQRPCSSLEEAKELCENFYLSR